MINWYLVKLYNECGRGGLFYGKWFYSILIVYVNLIDMLINFLFIYVIYIILFRKYLKY